MRCGERQIAKAVRALGKLRHVADIAARTGVGLVPTLFTGHMSGVNWIPAWATGGAEGDDRFRVVSGRAVQPRRRVLRNWYADAEITDAQVHLADRVASAFKVLSDPARLRLLTMIAATEEACVCDLTDALGLSQPTVSHHLKVLNDAGFVSREKRGTWAYFRLVPEALSILRAALTPA